MSSGGLSDQANSSSGRTPDRTSDLERRDVGRDVLAQPDLISAWRLVADVCSDAVAVRDTHVQLTYRELNGRAEATAAALLSAGVQARERIGLAVDRTTDTVAGLLGILMAGCAYVPLDPDYPSAYLSNTIEDADIRVVVAGQDQELSAALSTRARVIRGGGQSHGPVLIRYATPGADDVAYVIYTSGSTGRPKGCPVTHANVMALMNAAVPLFAVGSHDRWSVFHSFSFDFSVWELWGALLTGAQACLPPRAALLDGPALLHWLEDLGITVLSQVPSVFRRLTQADASFSSPCWNNLTHVFLGGEAVNPDVARSVLTGVTGPPQLINMYGITEITVHATYVNLTQAVLANGNPSPIGVALPHARILLCDDSGREVPQGEPGEIWVGGAGVIPGYLNRDELTALRFVQRSEADGLHRYYRSGDLARQWPDGSLEYLGRNDAQVKVRGFRIELGEVEACLRSIRGVMDAAAVVLLTPDGTEFLAVLWIASGEAVGERDVRLTVGQLLPVHMRPARYVRVSELPLTASGKLDRKRAAQLAS